MAITIATDLQTHFTPYALSRMVVTSDRDSTVTDSIGSGEITDNGSGKCRYAIAATPLASMYVDDVIEGSGFTNTALNVKQNITAKGANSIDTDLDYVAAYNTDSGTVTKDNENFKIGATIELKDTSGTSEYLSEIFKVADSSGNYVFDLGELLKSYLAVDFGDYITAGAFTILNNTVGGYKVEDIEFQEYFDDKDGQQIEGDSNDYGVDAFFFNGVIQTNESVQYYDATTVCTGTGTLGKFLTDQTKVHKDCDLQLAAIIADNQYRIRVTTYDVDGGLIAVDTSADQTINAYKRKSLFYSLKSYYDSDDSVYSLKIRLIEDSGTSQNNISENLDIDIDRKDYDHNIKFYWLNQYGGIDSYAAHFDRIEQVKPKKQRYKKNIGVSFDTFDRGYTTMSVMANRVGLIKGDFEDKTTQEWLKWLYISPYVIAEIDGVLVPVNILNSFTYINEEPIQPEIQYEYDNKLIIQNN